MKAIALRGALIGALTAAALLLLPLPTGDGLSRSNLSSRHEAAAAEPQGTSEKDAFEAAKELGTAKAWDAFLANYPTDFHADLARAYLKKLAGQETPPAATAPALAAGPSNPAHERPCTDAKKLSSERSTQAAKIRFINESGATIVIQWIDFKGNLKEYAQLKPGAELTQDTFLTHPWIAAYQEGSCRQLFLPAEGVSVARLLPEDQLSKKKASKDDEPGDHGPTPEQSCKDNGMDYNGSECVARKKKGRATLESHDRASRQGSVRRHRHDLPQRQMRAKDQDRARRRRK